MADMLKCVHKGCGSMFAAGDETQTCVHHPGAPVFHEGQKGWQCCKPRVLTFDEFLSIPPCTTGTHSSVDESATIATAEKVKQEAAASAIMAESQQRKRVPMSNTATSNNNAITPPVVKEKEEEEPETDTDDEDILVHKGRSCRRRGCGKGSIQDPPAKKSARVSGLEGKCIFHPGSPIFHEGSKGWSCCKRRVLEFSEFMKIEGCTTRDNHMYVGSGKTKAEKKKAKAVVTGQSGSPAEAEEEVEDLIEIVRHDMYQSSTTLTVSFYLKNIIPEKSTVLFHNPTGTNSTDDDAGKVPASSSVLYLDLRTSELGSILARHVRSTIPLFGPIVPSKSTFVIRKTKLELVLYKDVSLVGEVALGWPGLKADSAATGSIIQVGSAALA